MLWWQRPEWTRGWGSATTATWWGRLRMRPSLEWTPDWDTPGFQTILSWACATGLRRSTSTAASACAVRPFVAANEKNGIIIAFDWAIFEGFGNLVADQFSQLNLAFTQLGVLSLADRRALQSRNHLHLHVGILHNLELQHGAQHLLNNSNHITQSRKSNTKQVMNPLHHDY